MTTSRKDTLIIYPNGDWMVERPHATGSDFGPAHYGTKPQGRDADTQIAFYRKAGFLIDDRRASEVAA
jgi:hypothetical protein